MWNTAGFHAGRTAQDSAAGRHGDATTRRTRRLFVVAGLAVLVVVGLGMGSACSPGQPSGLGGGSDGNGVETSQPGSTWPSPSATPDPPATGSTALAAIPEAAMLRASDVGAGFAASDEQEGDDHGSIPMMMSYCGQGDYTSADGHVLAHRRRSVGVDDERHVLEEVVRYQGAWASRHLADLRAVLPRCRTLDIMGVPDARATLTVVANDFAGDGAVLIKEVRGALTQYHAMVHRGGVEARLRIHIGPSEAEARRITQLATERLCAALPSC
ncbi:MAG TPA: hypothetical protein VFB84_08710 [Micromonosporaceae bacterium]|nr:hypothetical protein [Micromonosporaceae bacterium]